jgi:hypothetical protein
VDDRASPRGRIDVRPGFGGPGDPARRPGGAEPVARFDIAPFALPNCPPGEYRFEEPRDVVGLEVRFRGRPPALIGVQYLRKTRPQLRLETVRDLDDPRGYGWMPIDDWFNGRWQEAAAVVRPGDGNTVIVAFQGLSAELPEAGDYDVAFRRTLGLRLVVPDPRQLEAVHVFTAHVLAGARARVRGRGRAHAARPPAL